MKHYGRFISVIILPFILLLIISISCEEEEKNKKPTCSITHPTSRAVILKGSRINITIETNDEDGKVNEVRYFIDNKGIASVKNFPFEYKWNTSNITSGIHIIKAKVFDNEEAFGEDTIQISIDIPMVTTKGGTFKMGCTGEQNACLNREKPAHTVTLDGFKISKYEITNQQYADFLNEIGVNSNGTYNGVEFIISNDLNYSNGKWMPEKGKEIFPVKVTWYGAKAFCEHHNGRLPTEAEWEFAARGGNDATSTLYAGSNDISEIAWYKGNSNNTHKVGTKSANELGIYDMSGNVWEWCNDWYSSNYYSSSPQDNPHGPSSGCCHVLRGGSWYDSAEFCRVSFRLDFAENCGRSPSILTLYEPGFRLLQVK